MTIGSHPSNDLVLADPTISRFHCELLAEPRGTRLRDLGSRNGTVVDGVRAVEVWLRQGSSIRLGPAELLHEAEDEATPLRLSSKDSLGGLVGGSPGMRAVFDRLERAAASDATVLIYGETGTGKEAAAECLHTLSHRADGPFVVVDCGALPTQLIESELFGHERGAFTGADRQRAGAFEQAQGGTIFLDEIGELPLEVQPSLLRVLERRTVRRLGSDRPIDVDVRVVAATNRELRVEVNERRFRSDLYYRLAVVTVHIPPLRTRPDDIPMLVREFLDRLRASDEDRAHLLTPAFLKRLSGAAWPGNVRELRNTIEQGLVLDEIPRLASPRAPTTEQLDIDLDMPFTDARRQAIARFEHTYVTRQIERHGGNVAAAAAAAGVDRTYFYRILRRHERGES